MKFKAINFEMKYSYSCQDCQKTFPSNIEFENLNPFFSPKCFNCTKKFVWKNMSPNLYFCQFFDKYFKVNWVKMRLVDFDLIIKKILSSVKVGSKGQKGQNYIIDLDRVLRGITLYFVLNARISQALLYYFLKSWRLLNLHQANIPFHHNLHNFQKKISF